MARNLLGRLFRFNRRERWGLIFLILGLGGLYGLGGLFPPRGRLHSTLPESLGKTSYNIDAHEYRPIERSKKMEVTAPFDPNSINEQQWQAMGISARTARTIRNYLAKGGRFRKAEDLRKIWGFRRSDAERLIPHVRIREASDRSDQPRTPPSFGLQPKSVFRPRIPLRVRLNTTDSSHWEALPGIGPGYARRILRYRERLGGFIRPEQVGETYQLPDSVFQKILPYLEASGSEGVRQLPINSISIDSLGRHPYCGYVKARLIVRYREQHGAYVRLEDLLNIETLEESWLSRIRPYLRVQ